MHATTTTTYQYGWHFFVTSTEGETDHYTLESLERRFDVGVRGASWEATALAQQLAHLTGGRVEALFEGRRVALAWPGWPRP